MSCVWTSRSFSLMLPLQVSASSSNSLERPARRCEPLRSHIHVCNACCSFVLLSCVSLQPWRDLANLLTLLAKLGLGQAMITTNTMAGGGRMNWFFCKGPVDKTDVRFTSLLGAFFIAQETTPFLNEYARRVDAGLRAERRAKQYVVCQSSRGFE